MHFIKLFIGSCIGSWLLLASLSLQAETERPSISAVVTDLVTASVTAIDHETREVSLRANGGDISFVAGPEVRNLAEVSVGDIVVAEYMEEVNIQVVPGDELEATRAEVVAAARAEEGEMPGAAVIDTAIEVAEVVAIDLEDNTFKLKDADGVITQYDAANPENLRASAVGDMVVTSTTRALAVSVQHPESIKE